MVASTWKELTSSLNDDDRALFSAYRQMCSSLPGTKERVHRTEIQFVVERVFSSGYMKSHHLEIVIDLLREASTPHLRAAFPTTRKIITHRLTIDSIEELETARDLIAEAHRDVGPGTR